MYDFAIKNLFSFGVGLKKRLRGTYVTLWKEKPSEVPEEFLS